MTNNILNVLYGDYIKPFQRPIVMLILFIIFSIAGYYGYLMYVKSTIENLQSENIANANRRISDVYIKSFFADWCPHCKKAKPEWEKFASEYDGKEMGYYKIHCETVDCTDGDNRQIQEYSIDGYPTVLMTKNNERVNYDARITEDNLKQFVEDYLKN